MTDPRLRTAAGVALLAAWLGSGGCAKKQDDKAKLPPTPATAQSRAAQSSASPSPSSSSPTSGEKEPGADDSGDTAEEPSAAAAPAPRIAADGTLLLTGTTVAYRKSTLAPKVSGTVAKVSVRAGATVKRSATLVVLEQTDFRLMLRQAQAAHATAKARLRAAQVEHKRLSGLLEDRAVPRSQFDKVSAQFDISKAALAQADVAVASARRKLTNAVVRAPFAGVITKVMISRGEAANTMPPTRLLTIEQIDKLELRVQVPETAVKRVTVGTPIRAEFTAIDRTIKTRIARVVSSLDTRTRSFTAIAELDNRDHALRPGMFAEVRLAGGRAAKKTR